MRKLMLLIALLLMAQLSTYAAYSIVIHRTDGKEDVIRLDKKPKLSFDESNLLVNTEGSTLSIPRSGISKIDFTPVGAGIADIDASGNLIEIVDADTYRLSGCGGVPFVAYDMAGRQVAAAVVDAASDSCTISLAACPAGIYLITNNNKSFKIIKK